MRFHRRACNAVAIATLAGLVPSAIPRQLSPCAAVATGGIGQRAVGLENEVAKGRLDDLKAIAEEVDLDTQAFDACLSARTYRSTVQKDIDEGTRLGATGTPTFFINGRVISGVQPLESFTRIVDEELARPN